MCTEIFCIFNTCSGQDLLCLGTWLFLSVNESVLPPVVDASAGKNKAACDVVQFVVRLLRSHCSAALLENPACGTFHARKTKLPRTSGTSPRLQRRRLQLSVWVTSLWCLKVWAVARLPPERSAWRGTASARRARASSSRASWRRLRKSPPASDLWASSSLDGYKQAGLSSTAPPPQSAVMRSGGKRSQGLVRGKRSRLRGCGTGARGERPREGHGGRPWPSAASRFDADDRTKTTAVLIKTRLDWSQRNEGKPFF